MVVKLEEELKEIKADQYDMNAMFKKFQEKTAVRVAELGEKIAQLKGEKTDTVVSEESIQIPSPEVEKEKTEDAEQEIVLPVGDENQEINKEEVSTESNNTEVSIPAVSSVEDTSKEVGIGTRELDQTPLTPTTTVVEAKDVKKGKKVLTKTSSDPAKAIMVSRAQKDKLSASVLENEKKALGETSTEEKQAETTDELKRQLQEMYDELPKIGEEQAREAAIDKINVLTKKINETAGEDVQKTA